MQADGSIAMTGAKGTIGTVLSKSLGDYTLRKLDLPDTDVRDLHGLISVFQGCSAVIHLAWDTATENWRSGKINPENSLMTFNVYEAARIAGVRRVIMASSVHADQFRTWRENTLLTADHAGPPTSPYGANKIFMEALGRYFAYATALEVVCVRFGGVNAEDVPPTDDFYERAVWLSHADCAALVRTALESPEIPDGFVILYGVSDNPTRIHELSNPLGWRPAANS